MAPGEFRPLPVGIHSLETDYLVVGAGAAGLAFTDSLIAECEARVLVVDRKDAPGGHWNDAYDFVRLHQPSVYYGVNSMPLGGDALQTTGPEAGLYARASAAEIRAYYERVMHSHLIPSGRVRYLPQWDFVRDGAGRGTARISSRLTGEEIEVKVRRRIVDATFLSPSVPATTPPPFEVATGATCISVDALPRTERSPAGYVVVGAGKTAMDTCVWLLERGVDPGKIRWIKPRESWLLNRTFTQPGSLVGNFLEGIARQMEAAAHAASPDDLFDRLADAEQVRRVDPSVRPTMYKSATIGDWEIALLRRIEDVVRLGHVRRIERDRIVLADGEVPTSPDHLHIHCAADGLRRPPPLPLFDEGRITLQPVRSGVIPFNAALVAFVEAHRRTDTEKNRLCPPNPLPHTAFDWIRNTLVQLGADRAWSREPDIVGWLERSRLNPTRGIRSRAGSPEVSQPLGKFVEFVRPAAENLARLSRGL